MERIPQSDLRAHAEMNAFYIVPAEREAVGLNLFSTHPPMEKRIAALSRLEAPAAGHARVALRAWASSTRCSGRRKVKGPAPDRLFAISTAYVDLDASRASRRAARPAIVFQPLATGDFRRSCEDMEEVLKGTSAV